MLAVPVPDPCTASSGIHTTANSSCDRAVHGVLVGAPGVISEAAITAGYETQQGATRCSCLPAPAAAHLILRSHLLLACNKQLLISMIQQLISSRTSHSAALPILPPNQSEAGYAAAHGPCCVLL